MSTHAARIVTLCLGVFSLVLLSAGCGTTETSATIPSTIGPTSTSTSRPTDVFDEAGYAATTVVTGLRIPWEMRFLPDGRLLVTEREGAIVITDVGTGQVTDVGSIDVLVRGEGGLMGLALDPDFPDTPRIYVSYTTSESGEARNRVSSFELVDLTGGSPALGLETALLDGIPADSNHNGSRLAFACWSYTRAKPF